MKFMLDVPTIERLIGGDTEVELDLKQAAASEFAKRHNEVRKIVKEYLNCGDFKKLVEAETFHQAREAAKNEIKALLK